MSGGRRDWRNSAQSFLRIALGGSFLSAVADRFGLWGAYEYPNVAWGSYSRFVVYTAKLLWLLPPACPPRLMSATRPAPKARTLRSYYEEWIETKFLRSFERTTTETNTVRSLRTMPRRLHSDGSEFVFLSPEGKADDGHVVAEARSGAKTSRRRV